MTTRQKFESMLCERGLFESAATKVMDYAIPLIDEELQKQDTSRITWNLPAEGYPNALYATLFLTHIKRHVLDWASINMPMAWWKPMFE